MDITQALAVVGVFLLVKDALVFAVNAADRYMERLTFPE